MIFATFGTASPFPRLLKRLDDLAKETGLEIVVQTGTTPQDATCCRMFDYAPSLVEYFHRAELVISHAGLGTQLELLRMHKAFVVVPRRACYGEHNDDHQLETCEILGKKYGIRYFVDIEELNAEILKNPPEPYPFSDDPLLSFREKVLPVILGGQI